MPDAPRPTLILVGGSVRAAAADAVAAGYSVVALDRFGDRDLRAIADQWFPLDEHWQRRLAAWPTVPLIATGGFPWRRTHGLRGERLVTFPAPAAYRALRDPAQLRQAAARSGISFPATISSERRAARPAVADPLLPPGRWLLKPRYGTGGIGIREAAARSFEPDTQRLDEPRLDEPADLQQWVAGRPLGACYFARLRDGQRLTWLLGACAGLTHRQHRPWRWLYGGSLGPLHASAACQQQLTQIGTELARRFNLVGLFNVDLIRRRDGSLVLLEINPRYSASMELLRFPASRDQPGPWASLIDWHLAAYEEQAGLVDRDAADQRTAWSALSTGTAVSAAGEDGRRESAAVPAAAPEPQATPESACKQIVYASAPMQLDCSDETLQQRFGLAVEQQLRVQVSFHDLPPIGSTVPAGAPALSVIVRGRQDAVTLRRAAQRIAAELRRDLRAP